MNNLASIQPLQNQRVTLEMKVARVPFFMNWRTDMSMEWTIETLKQAAEFNPEYKDIGTTTLHGHIGTFQQSMTTEAFRNVGPLQIDGMLTASLAQPAAGDPPMELLPSPRTPKLTFCGIGSLWWTIFIMI
jgi:hypothetical protein